MRFLTLVLGFLIVMSSSSYALDRKDMCEVIGEAIKRINSNYIMLEVSSEKVALDQIGDNSCRTSGFPYKQILKVPEGYSAIKVGDKVHVLATVMIKGKFRTYALVKNIR